MCVRKGETEWFQERGSNSAGRVRACQGRCRRFESGLPLHISVGKPGTANQLQKRELVAVPALRIGMKHLLFQPLICALAAVSALAQDYKLEPLVTAAPGLSDAYAKAIQTQGVRVSGASGAWCEVWLAKSLPVGAKPDDAAISFGIAQGTLLGVIRFPGKGADRRGQVIPAGVYTLRYSLFPVDGAHSGVAPQRDFALLTPLAADPDPAANPAFDDLVKMSRKASGSPHPAVLSLETPPAGAAAPSVAKEGEHDWTLTVKAGDLTFSIIVAGKTEG